MRGGRSKQRRRQARLTLVLGGASSGKSAVGLQVAARSASGKPSAFVATAQALDAEMAEKIRRHQSSRSRTWETHEVPVDVVAWFQKHGAAYRTIILDCVTLWLHNLLAQGFGDAEVLQLMRDLLHAMRATRAGVVVISNELGLGLVPVEPAARRFRDLAGQVNQCIAAEADEAYFVMSGLPVRIK